MESYKYNIFGREVLIERRPDSWMTFYQGSEGKRRKAGIVIPDEIDESGLTQYLSDLCHEWACEKHPNVICIWRSK